MAFLELIGLTKWFKTNLVLDALALSVDRGEILAVFGPSGSGKTVLLRLIAGIETADAGRIRIGGQDVTDLSPEHRSVGMAFQNFALYSHLPAFENIASPLRAQRRGEAEIRRRVGEIAELLRIDHVLSHRPRELSNGQKQRTALARALVQQPAVLLLDDPLRNVDAKLRYEMRNELPPVLSQFHTTALYVTQDYKEAMALGDRIGVLADGRFQQIGPPASIYADPINAKVAQLFGDPTLNLVQRPVAGDAGRRWIEWLGARIPLPGHHASPERRFMLGVRPEHIEVSPIQRPGWELVELDAVTPLGTRSLLLLKDPCGQEVIASCPEDEATGFGRGHRNVWVHVDPGRVLVFDEQTGARIAAT